MVFLPNKKPSDENMDVHFKHFRAVGEKNYNVDAAAVLLHEIAAGSVWWRQPMLMQPGDVISFVRSIELCGSNA